MSALEEVLSAEGWPYASAPPVEPGDPGRFHALFGRDSLITALQMLPARPDVAFATLGALAARQGVRVDAGRLEEPGKIGHEFRDAPPPPFVEAGWPDSGPFAFYGTADATPWFLVLLGALGDPSLHVAARDAAASWLADQLEVGGGLLRHSPGSWPGGLVQMGWRDTIDAALDPGGGGYVRLDGSNPVPPLADADTQAVAVAALRALFALTGDPAWSRRLTELRARLSADFTPDVMALEAGDVVVSGAGSQLGWLLWADALEDPHPAALRLSSPDILTDFGLRTLSSAHPAFRVDAYHRGSVWPFDSWLGWGGLRAAGFETEAERVRTGVLAALQALGRAPELYGVGLDGALVPLPASNRVQAWTIGARFALEQRWDGR